MMEGVRGNLLVGGMSLKGLEGVIDHGRGAARWSGRLAIQRTQRSLVESGRPCRLELEDGRAGQVVVGRVDTPFGPEKLLIEFDGLSPLA